MVTRHMLLYNLHVDTGTINRDKSFQTDFHSVKTNLEEMSTVRLLNYVR